MAKVSIFDYLGGDALTFDADFDGGHVYVAAPTLIRIAAGWLANGPVGPKDNADTALAFLGVTPDRWGRYDITGFGPDLAGWENLVDDEVPAKRDERERDRAEKAAFVAAVVQSENMGFGSVTRAIEINAEQLRVDEARRHTGACWLWSNGYATRDEDGTLAGYMDGGEEQANECRMLRLDSECDVHEPYFDHDGVRTDDPHCELGLCAECIDSTLVLGTSVIPALSLADPRFATDSAYRERVVDAYVKVGVTFRQD